MNGEIMMAFLSGIILYLPTVAFFVAFAKFLNEGDNSISRGLTNETKNRNRRNDPVRNLF